MTTISIQGHPLVRFVFDWLDSINKYIGVSRARNRGYAIGYTRKWRKFGENLAQEFMDLFHLNMRRKYLVSKRAFVWVRICRKPSEVFWDVPNTHIKALQDGFTDACVWPDDDHVNVPHVMFSWIPIDPDESERIEIEVHELERFTHNGVALPLPEGRERKTQRC